MVALRNADARRAFTAMHGSTFPDNDVGRQHLFIALHIRAPKGEGEPVLRRYVARAAPWMDDEEAAKLLDRVYTRPLKFKADTLGKLIGLEDVVRTGSASLRSVPVT